MTQQEASTTRPTTTTAETLDPQEILRRLRDVAALKLTDEPPAWMGNNNWAPRLSALCKDAADLIERCLP